MQGFVQCVDLVVQLLGLHVDVLLRYKRLADVPVLFSQKIVLKVQLGLRRLLDTVLNAVPVIHKRSRQFQSLVVVLFA